ncbi:MAG: MBL fold metallo-hydrolase [Deltaproteobacteria bacterium]|nr:MBL fold metallo-hydrolase [Deltaproteobacteria bacterium]MBW1985916.1 MBL fold metallo-hydrolase [Deltaproteobacteria bacterium]MBW2133676.1 MBL fold metallo-hydrolase [Deltaproteobacteria bacterium]
MAFRLLIALFILLLLLFLAECGRPRPPLSPLPSHHTANGFRNPHIQTRSRSLDFFRWQLGLGPNEEPALPVGEVPPYNPEAVSPDLDQIYNPNPGRIQVTWIGHSSFLIQVDGVNILTDPVFSDRASPLTFVGPRRVAPPGLSLAQLPPIQAVVISHNHYDHLDIRTVVSLGDKTQFFVPLGLARWFKKNDLHKVTELDWWHSASLGPIRVHCVPAQHFSMRSPFDANETLWSGWVLETASGKIFFSCDTGYCPDFKEIGRRLGPMRLSLIPIGGYMPRWFMRPMHVNPKEAVMIHQDVGSRQSIGMHWGTFKLTDEPMGEPPVFLQRALRQAKIPEDRFIVLRLGETRIFP